MGALIRASNVGALNGIGAAPDMWKQINAQEDTLLHAQLAQAAQQAGVGQAVFTNPVLPPPATTSMQPNNLTLANRARELFLRRMGGIRAEMKVASNDFLQCHVYNEQVYVFYCFGGRHGVTLEPIDMFPSDQLITQFRLVLT
jgi:hypothetical protein